MSSRSVDLLIGDIIDAGNKILRYTTNLSYEEFIADDKTVDAVIRNFEIVGEAASKVSKDEKPLYTQGFLTFHTQPDLLPIDF